MNIPEFRAQLNRECRENRLGGFPASAPDWVVERLLKNREAEAARKASRTAERRSEVPAVIAASEAERIEAANRIRRAQLSAL